MEISLNMSFNRAKVAASLHKICGRAVIRQQILITLGALDILALGKIALANHFFAADI